MSHRFGLQLIFAVVLLTVMHLFDCVQSPVRLCILTVAVVLLTVMHFFDYVQSPVRLCDSSVDLVDHSL